VVGPRNVAREACGAARRDLAGGETIGDWFASLEDAGPAPDGRQPLSPSTQPFAARRPERLCGRLQGLVPHRRRHAAIRSRSDAASRYLAGFQALRNGPTTIYPAAVRALVLRGRLPLSDSARTARPLRAVGAGGLSRAGGGVAEARHQADRIAPASRSRRWRHETHARHLKTGATAARRRRRRSPPTVAAASIPSAASSYEDSGSMSTRPKAAASL